MSTQHEPDAPVFISPELDEIVDLSTSDDIAEIPLSEQLSDVHSRWDALQEVDAPALLELIRDELGSHPQEKRDILMTWMTRELGYKKRHAKPRQLERGAVLWSLFHDPDFNSLGQEAHDALLEIARATPSARPTLHPLSALSALLLWLHESPYNSTPARELLTARALPDDHELLEQLVRTEARPPRSKRSQKPRSLLDLAKLELDAGFHNTAAFIGAMHLSAPSSRGALDQAALERGCDRAAMERPRAQREWIELVCTAAMRGHLTHSWLERLFAACIRLNIDNPNVEAELRAYHATRPYEADLRRLLTLYIPLLEANRRADEPRSDQELLSTEAARLRETNPRRSQQLFELSLLYNKGRRGESKQNKLERALESIEESHFDHDEIATLSGLYVQNYAIDPVRVAFVRRWRSLCDHAHLDAEELELFLIVGDYERAFQHLTCKYDGVQLHHADKHAATRVKYFVEKRVKPGSVAKMIDAAFTPFGMLGAAIGDIGAVHRAVGRGLELFEARTSSQDLSAEVIGDLGDHGAAISSFDEISDLSIAHIEDAIRRHRSQRLFLGALSGGLSGGLAPLTWGIISLADIPVTLALVADLCAKFCWYYGFDPREDPELPMEILAVALGGSRPDAIQPMLLRQNLREFAIRKSVVVGALARGALNQAAGRAITQLMETQVSSQIAQRATDLARDAVQRNFQQRAIKATSKSLPILGAILGATLNVALLYDICEAAQAVLTDRFLERKYPDWARQFDLELLEDSAAEEE